MGINTGWGGGGTVSITANRAAVSNGSGALTASATTATEISYISGLSSAVQTQLDGKAASSHNHAASAITSGTIDTARLGSGTANSSSYLRGDGAWTNLTGVSAAPALVRITSVSQKGSTNTNIYRLPAATETRGTGITITDSAANGGYITVDVAGVYFVSIQSVNGSGAAKDVQIMVGTSLVNTVTATETEIRGVGLIPNGSYHPTGAIPVWIGTSDKLYFSSLFTPTNTYPLLNTVTVARGAF